LVEHRARIAKCSACARQGLAFCDRRAAADSMLNGAFTEDMDECMPKTVEQKAACSNFVWDGLTNSSELAGGHFAKTKPVGGLFKQAVCPCYDRVNGAPIEPHWFTDAAHCRELEWPGKAEEKNHKHAKFQEWALGFKKKKHVKKKMLNLDDSMHFDYNPGCAKGYRCCNGFLTNGTEILRCMDITNYNAGSHCKYFRPSDSQPDMDGRWHHERREFRCTITTETFQGHWKPLGDGEDWMRAPDADQK